MIVLNGIKFGILLALLIGPVFFTIIQTSIERGFWNGVLVAFGVSLSDIFYVIIVYFGLAQFLEDGQFRVYMAYGGGAILIFFGLYHVIIKSRRRLGTSALSNGEAGFFKYVLKGFVINGLSPMVIVFWIGLISIASLEFNYHTGAQYFVFLTSILLTVLITDLTKAYLADKLRAMITPRLLTLINVILGVALIGFGVRLIVIAQTFYDQLVL
ncbi:MAG: LysE family transporter [Cyclobacteriaceae bacterium]